MKTVKIPVSQLSPGMIVADNVYTFSNQLIIQAGTQLSDKIITRLKFYSVDMVHIRVEDNTLEPLPIAPLVKELYLEKLKGSHEFLQFNQTLLKSVDKLKTAMQSIIDGSTKIDMCSLYEDVNSIITSSRNGLHVFDMLHCMRDYDDVTYIHSINVALICNVLGTWSHFTDKDLETVTLCGLFHDIGKMTIPEEIMKKPSKLTAEEYITMKEHTVHGYNVLSPLDINIHIKMAAMMHHERCDGSGYPLGLQGKQIDKFAKIVMIADVYDAMTSARVYRGPLCPFEVISVFEDEGLTKYEPKYIMTFLDHIMQLYLNCTIRLNDGTVGKIILMHRDSLSRPVIRVNDDFIDLEANHELYITAIL